MPSVLALDPGGTSGLAYAEWLPSDPPRLDTFDSWEEDPYGALATIDRLAGRVLAVVCESFIPRPGVRTWQPDALEQIGAARYLCRRSGTLFVLQAPGDAKRFSTNDRLRKIGWYKSTPGGHASDAARHLLLYAVRCGLLDPLTLRG